MEQNESVLVWLYCGCQNEDPSEVCIFLSKCDHSNSTENIKEDRAAFW